MKKVIEFIKHYPELLFIPLAFILWILSIPILRFIDPTSGVFDAGIFQIPIFAIILFFMFLSISWFSLKIIFGRIGKFLRFEFKNEFQNLTSWEKIKLSYVVYFSLLFLLAYLAKTLVI